MKRSNSLLLSSIGLALCFGIFLGWLMAPKKAEEAVNKESVITSFSGVSKKSSTRTEGLPLLLSTYSVDEISKKIKEEYDKPEKDQDYARLSILFNEWVINEPFEALDFALEHDRDDWVFEGLRIAGQRQFDTALVWIDSSSKDLFRRLTLKESVYLGLAQVNPREAVARIEQMDAGSSQDRLMIPVLNEWAAQDIDKVFDWIDSQETSPLKDKAYESVLFTYINSNPEEAMPFISSMEENTDKINFANRVAFKNAEKNLEDVINWVEDQEGATKLFATMGLMEYWAQSENPADALEYAKDLPEGPESEEVFSMVSYKLSQGDPEMLENQLNSLDESQQIIAARHLAQTYSNFDTDKTVEWIETLSSGPVRDSAITTSLSSLQYTDVNQAFSLSESLSDTSVRSNQILNTLRVWVANDSQAAYSALSNSTSLDNAEKESIRKTLLNEEIPAPDYFLPQVE